MLPAEKKAFKNAKESLNDFPGAIMVQYLENKDLEILVKMIERLQKEGKL